jgi:hypothetical protein
MTSQTGNKEKEKEFGRWITFRFGCLIITSWFVDSQCISPLSILRNTGIVEGSLWCVLEWAADRYDLVGQFEEFGIDTCAAVTASVGSETLGEGDEQA